MESSGVDNIPSICEAASATVRFPLSDTSQRANVPSVNIAESDTAFELALAAPGKTRKDFNVELDDHVLTVSSESKHEDTTKTEQYTRREFRYDNFQRSFRLPDSIDSTKIVAKSTQVKNSSSLMAYVSNASSRLIKP